MNTIRFCLLTATIVLVLSMLACSGEQQPNASGTETPDVNNVEATESIHPATTETATAVPTKVPSACDNPYMPIVANATWNYKLTGPAPDTFTHTIVSVDDKGFTEQDVFTVGVTRQGQWTCEGGNLIALSMPTGSSGTVQTDNNVQVDMSATEMSGITLPAAMNANDTWSQALTLEGTETINGMELPARSEIQNNCTALGVEEVTVEAGSFDAMKVECKSVMNISITVGGSETSATFNLTGTSWYAENVGMVKNLTTGMGFDSVTELVSYEIPK